MCKGRLTRTLHVFVDSSQSREQVCKSHFIFLVIRFELLFVKRVAQAQREDINLKDYLLTGDLQPPDMLTINEPTLSWALTISKSCAESCSGFTFRNVLLGSSWLATIRLCWTYGSVNRGSHDCVDCKHHRFFVYLYFRVLQKRHFRGLYQIRSEGGRLCHVKAPHVNVLYCMI